ncbi:transcription factor Spi-C-like [Saccoglossus kowalevskii]
MATEYAQFGRMHQKSYNFCHMSPEDFLEPTPQDEAETPSSSTVTQPPKRKRGRPPKFRPPEQLKEKRCHPILWKFLLENLNDPQMSKCVTWVNKEVGVFKFESANKEEIAQKWGQRKGNRKLMTYQKMARALRDYGKKGIIRKHRRRLHYIFLPRYLVREANENTPVP